MALVPGQGKVNPVTQILQSGSQNHRNSQRGVAVCCTVPDTPVFRRQLEYKSIWYRKHLAVINRYFPSSKLCRECGAINQNLALSDRVWTCECGAVHDRDLNAAQNIRAEGMRHIPLVYGLQPVPKGIVPPG